MPVGTSASRNSGNITKCLKGISGAVSTRVMTAGNAAGVVSLKLSEMAQNDLYDRPGFRLDRPGCGLFCRQASFTRTLPISPHAQSPSLTRREDSASLALGRPLTTLPRRSLARPWYYGAMGGDSRFWYMFGGIWLVVGVCFVAASLGINLFADPDAINEDAPLWLFALVGIAATIAGAVVVYLAHTTAARDARLMQSGVQLTATVIDIRRSMIEINRQTRWQVVYRYEYTKGRPLHGKSRALSGETVSAFKPGDKVLIKVDPRQPEESLFLGAA